MRKRFKLNKLASSDITIQKIKVRHYFVECFGKLVEVNEIEATRLSRTVRIITK